MYKKILLQLLLVLILLCSSYLFYDKYLNKTVQIEKKAEKEKNKLIIKDIKKNISEKKINTNDNLDISEDENLKESSNILKNIKYMSKDSEGNIYEISAKQGIVNITEPDITSMNYVVAKIFLIDKSVIEIRSDYAVYNRENYNTNFSGKVKLNYLTHYVSCEKMDILFDKNLAALYENLIYKNKKTRLNADRLEIDLLTKNSKIFMFDNNEKISIVSNN